MEKGDPYPKQIQETVQLVMELGAWPNPHGLCFQSKVGPQKWIQPSLADTVDKLARSGIKRVLVIPISFLTEHIETLHEINIEAREHAESPVSYTHLHTRGLSRSELSRAGPAGKAYRGRAGF